MILAFVLAAMAAPAPAEARPPARPKFRNTVASWYGPGLWGNRTACGQTLRPWTYGVAHKTLRCGTRVRVCKYRCVTTRVIDRGPFVSGREFDLTQAVKNAIGMGNGVYVVRVRVG